MDVIGVIAEYNPFHNGHIYHIERIKEMYPDSVVVLVMSSTFTQRGIPSIINKWKKTEIALNHNIDIVVELPYIFSTQSADIFAKESINLLKELKVNKLIFGSESDDIKTLELMAKTQIENKEYDKLVKKYMNNGLNYPTAMNKALFELTNLEVKESNDLLGLSYIKEITKQKANIEYITIKRTNNYLGTNLDDRIASASAIRNGLVTFKDIKEYVPSDTYKTLYKERFFMNDYFNILKYKIYSSNDLSKYLDVDEGIENRILKVIDEVNNYDELVEKIKTKRYTYNKINRMFCHILCGFTKDLRDKFTTSTYIRILGFSKNGQKYLNKIKKDTSIPIITKFIKNEDILDFEMKVLKVYVNVLNNKKQKEYIEMEYKSKIIIK